MDFDSKVLDSTDRSAGVAMEIDTLGDTRVPTPVAIVAANSLRELSEFCKPLATYIISSNTKNQIVPLFLWVFIFLSIYEELEFHSKTQAIE